jgi:hypothetical protein
MKESCLASLPGQTRPHTVQPYAVPPGDAIHEARLTQKSLEERCRMGWYSCEDEDIIEFFLCIVSEMVEIIVSSQAVQVFG